VVTKDDCRPKQTSKEEEVERNDTHKDNEDGTKDAA
jgi:hypothetical protein